MLTNPKINDSENQTCIDKMIIGCEVNNIIEDGIIMTNSYNFNHYIINTKDDYYDFDDLGSYGVCDNIDQVKAKYAKWLNDPNLNFCISFTSVKKSEQSKSGGWRWHKWGGYIGTQDPKCEYLYDEEDIEEVFAYHIFHLKD